MSLATSTELTHRADLIDRLLVSNRLTIVCAPAGFGKTRLLRSLEQRTVGHGIGKVIYIDRRTHNDDDRLASHHISQWSSENDIDACILIDDADDCDGQSLSATLDKTDFRARNLRVVVAMRDPQSVSFARLMASDETNIVTAETLQLNSNEKKAILSSVPRHWRARTDEMAGCWPVAMKLFSDWATANPSGKLSLQSELIQRQSGVHSFIKEQLVQYLNKDQLRALGYVSLFEEPKFTTFQTLFPEQELDKVVVDLLESHRGLIDLEGDVLVLSPAFRSYLINHLKDTNPDFANIASHCAEYLAETGNLTEAAHLASLAGRFDQIDDIVARHGNLQIWVVQGFQVVRNVVESAGTDAVLQYARLKMMSAIVHLKEGRVRSAENVYRELEKGSSSWPDLAVDLEVLRITLLVYGCNLEREGELQTFSEIARSAEADAAWKTLLSTLSCLLHSQRGRLEQAQTDLNEARIQAGLAPSEYNILFSYVHETGIHLAQSKLKQARTALAKARKLWRNKFVDDEGVDTVISAFSASIEYESGRLTSARNAVRRSARRFPHSEAWFDIYAAAYEAMFRLLVQDRGIETAIASIEDQKQLLDQQGLPRVSRMLEGLRVILLSENNLKKAKSSNIFSENDLTVGSSATWQEFETYTLAKAHMALSKGDCDDAIGLLEHGIDHVTKLQLRRSEVRFLIVLSICHLVRNRNNQAEQTLLSAVTTAAQDGLIQIFREFAEIEIMAQCLSSLKTHASLRKSQVNFIHKILANSLKESKKLDATISERESEILVKLGDGGSDKFIARQLGISEHGVRYHLKNIYRKLAVHDRTSAVAVASARDLI